MQKWCAGAVLLALALSACGAPYAVSVRPVATTDTLAPPAPSPSWSPADITIGPAATDSVGGWLPDGVTLSPFDVKDPIVGLLDPALLTAVQDATRAASKAGIDMRVNSGWRTRGFQQRLFDDAVERYGSVAAAGQFVASPDASKHVSGEAVDIAPVDADNWLIRNGPQFGLCQIYANEIWHFELAADAQGRCPPLKLNAAG